MTFYHAASSVSALYDVWVYRPLKQPVGAADTARLFFEYADEELADYFALALRFGHAFEGFQKSFARVYVADVEIERAVCLHHPLSLVLAQHPVVDEYTVKPVAYGALRYGRGDRRIYAAREPADHRAALDLFADFFYLAADPLGAESPVRFAAADVEDEGGQYFPTLRRVRDFGMELQRRDAAVGGFEARKRPAFAPRRDPEALRRFFHLVPMAHPDVELFISAAAREKTAVFDLHDGVSVLRRFSAFDDAAEELREELHAVAYAEDRYVRYQIFRERRRADVKDAPRPTGNYYSFWVDRGDFFLRRIPKDYLAVNAELAHAARYELCIL